MTLLRVWNIFKQNRPALIGLGLFLFFILTTLLAQILSTDSSPYASVQIHDAVRVSPGTHAPFLKIRNRSESYGLWESLFSGKPAEFQLLRLSDSTHLNIAQDSLWVNTFQNETRYFLMPVILYHPDPEEPFNAACLKQNGKPYLLHANSCIWTEQGKYCSQSLHQMEMDLHQTSFTQITWWMGTDALGRDVWSRLLKGGRVSIGVGLAAVGISLLIGLPLGIIAGYFGGWVDKLIQGFISIIWSLPSMLLAMVLSFVFGKGFWQVFLAIGFTLWVDVARMVRGSVLSLRESLFIEAAQTLGYSIPRILFFHLLPNLAGPVILVSASCFATAVLIESGLSFLGIGIQPPMPSWGNMLQEGYLQIVLSGGQWLAIFPGLAIVVLVVSLNLIGYGLRDALDPREKA